MWHSLVFRRDVERPVERLRTGHTMNVNVCLWLGKVVVQWVQFFVAAILASNQQVALQQGLQVRVI